MPKPLSDVPAGELFRWMDDSHDPCMRLKGAPHGMCYYMWMTPKDNPLGYHVCRIQSDTLVRTKKIIMVETEEWV